jgi:outer membrane protein assembly factor BamD (BamD/ComL family)
MRLASTLEETPDAVTAYRRLIEEFPSSVYLSDAKRRMEYLGGRG